MHTQAGKEMTMGDMTHGGRAADPAITIIVGGVEQRSGQAERERGETTTPPPTKPIAHVPPLSLSLSLSL